MSGTAWFHTAFGVLVVVIFLIVWAAMMLEAGPGAPAREQDTAEPGSEPGEPDAPQRKAA